MIGVQSLQIRSGLWPCPGIDPHGPPWPSVTCCTPGGLRGRSPITPQGRSLQRIRRPSPPPSGRFRSFGGRLLEGFLSLPPILVRCTTCACVPSEDSNQCSVEMLDSLGRLTGHDCPAIVGVRNAPITTRDRSGSSPPSWRVSPHPIPSFRMPVSGVVRFGSAHPSPAVGYW